MSDQEDMWDQMFFSGRGETLEEALEAAGDKAKRTSGNGFYEIVKVQVEVGDSLHDYKVLLGPGVDP
jgi:hypothetical protein